MLSDRQTNPPIERKEVIVKEMTENIELFEWMNEWMNEWTSKQT